MATKYRLGFCPGGPGQRHARPTVISNKNISSRAEFGAVAYASSLIARIHRDQKPKKWKNIFQNKKTPRHLPPPAAVFSRSLETDFFATIRSTNDAPKKPVRLSCLLCFRPDRYCRTETLVARFFAKMSWFFSADDDDEDENLLFSPALMARRASESWIDTPPIEVCPFGVYLVEK